ncbi:hypothetical protein K439DRAFT_1637189 [Ramaria rubella]|nr:hypothetical protein K439DRAFT_1637189 [Ramaria rubella]
MDSTTSSSSQVVIFTPFERTGVIIMASAGVTSCVFVSTLLLSIVLTTVSPWPRKSPETPTIFVNKQFAVFVICLLVSDFIQSISGITQIKWAVENKIYESTACRIQAATLVMGDLGSTVWSCVIAAHTFTGLALGKQWSNKVVGVIVVLGWTFVITLTAFGPVLLTKADKGSFFSIAGTWCFISSEYAVARLVIHYIPLFIAAAVIFIFYILVFLVLRGNLNFTPETGSVSLCPHTPIMDALSHQRIILAKRMLWYPIAYLTCILPIAVTRLVGFDEETVPESVWIFGMFFLFSLGAADAVIYTTTRHLLKPLYTTLAGKSRPASLASLITKPQPAHIEDAWNRPIGKSIFEDEMEDGVYVMMDRIREII